jgi:putative pyruvate formate lyase activating enzyme
MLDLTRGIDPVQLRRAIQWAESAYVACNVCPANCQVNRLEGEHGLCGLGAEGRVYKEYLHLGEESVLCPSHTIYFTGCNFRCAFCSDLAQVTRPQDFGVVLEPAVVAQRIALRRSEGAINVNFVGGLPDVNILYILRVLSHCPDDTHVVWNTNMWTTETAVSKLSGVVGTWLADLKFGNDHCARKLSGVQNYWNHTSSILRKVDPSANLLVRHLLMPGHLECCTRPVLEWLSTHLPQAVVNVMTGYHPFALTHKEKAMGQPLSQTERSVGLDLIKNYPCVVLLDGRE